MESEWNQNGIMEMILFKTVSILTSKNGNNCGLQTATLFHSVYKPNRPVSVILRNVRKVHDLVEICSCDPLGLRIKVKKKRSLELKQLMNAKDSDVLTAQSV
jgi:hypothetical protein